MSADLQAHGLWSQARPYFYISAWELLVPLIFLLKFLSIQNTSVCFHMDNQSSVWCIECQESSQLEILLTISEVLLDLLVHSLHLFLTTLPSGSSKHLGRCSVPVYRVLCGVAPLLEVLPLLDGLVLLLRRQSVFSSEPSPPSPLPDSVSQRQGSRHLHGQLEQVTVLLLISTTSDLCPRAGVSALAVFWQSTAYCHVHAASASPHP